MYSMLHDKYTARQGQAHAGDLTMELVGKAEDGRLAFTYVHTPNYKVLFAAVV